MKAIAEQDAALIEGFLDALWMERGLSENTLSAYRNDLSACAAWLSAQGGELITASRADLLDYLSFRVEQGSKPRSTARLLSSLRRLYRYLVREGRLHDDPTARIEAPKLGRSLPKTLTEAEVELEEQVCLLIRLTVRMQLVGGLQLQGCKEMVLVLGGQFRAGDFLGIGHQAAHGLVMFGTMSHN